MTPGSSLAPSAAGARQFPTYQLPQGAAVPAGIANGRLVDEGDCLVLKQSDDSVLMVVWPAGYRRDGQTIYAGDHSVATVGDDVVLYGGSFTDQNFQDLQKLLDADLSSSCRIGTYWLTVEMKP